MFARLLPLALLASPALAAPQDPFEPNDDCATAAAVPMGLTSNLTLGPDDDYFVVTASAGQVFTASANDSGGNPLDVEIYDAGCGSVLTAAAASDASVVTCAAGDLVVRVLGATSAGVDYDLELSETPFVDDAAEPNDTLATATPIGSFSTPELMVSSCSEDWWFYRVLPNDFRIQIDVASSLGTGNVELELYDDMGTLLSSSVGPENTESVEFTNMSMTAQVIRIRVFEASASHSRYMLTVCFSGPGFPQFIGDQVCESQANSTGRPATLCAIGSDVVADDDVRLGVFSLPMNSFGYFVASRTTSFVVDPGDVTGNLCLGAPGRYSFLIQNSMNTSSVFFNTEGSPAPTPGFTLPNTPLAGGAFTAVMPGERWHWQYWYRDAVGGVATSNFSSAVSVDFQ